MFLEVKEEELEPGQAYLRGSWPVSRDGTIGDVEHGPRQRFFGPITLHGLAIDRHTMTHELIPGTQIVASVSDRGVWTIYSTTTKNTPAYQDFERVSIHIEGEKS